MPLAANAALLSPANLIAAAAATAAAANFLYQRRQDRDTADHATLATVKAAEARADAAYIQGFKELVNSQQKSLERMDQRLTDVQAQLTTALKHHVACEEDRVALTRRILELEQASAARDERDDAQP